MLLKLAGVEKKVGLETWLHPLDLTLRESAVTVLLGVTRAGKTSLMRVMAGLDTPTAGRVLVDGHDVTGVPVRDRNIAMVYQQFINYPSMTVFDNIASPLRLRGQNDIQSRVGEIARTLHIEEFLGRLPAELSGGQQQRVALARALAKDAPLMLLDEPLVNLDYKLREDLREELSLMFAQGRSSVVYATTEPGEALLLGGYTAVLDQGELLQYGPTIDVFRRPVSMRVARAFSDPPMNFLSAQVAQGVLRCQGINDMRLPDAAALPAGPVTVGLRAADLSLRSQGEDCRVSGQVQLAEISGSATYVHADTPVGTLIAQVPGVSHHQLGDTITFHFSSRQAYVFGADETLLHAPYTQEANRGAY
ncbi:ABC transporter ATP-binding protein [Castellaniella sp.]|uniref:ABC transporter ATP-binding protein n=1 Tax=Castellaniella sp. TaxID=1955812 RepID=UPI002AFF4153|nr:ABC transporter ATP-binding protein [Castellaniella sp.]